MVTGATQGLGLAIARALAAIPEHRVVLAVRDTTRGEADTSTPERSAAAAAWLLTDPAVRARSGEVFGYEREPSVRVWPPARDPELGRRALDETLALLGRDDAV